MRNTIIIQNPSSSKTFLKPGFIILDSRGYSGLSRVAESTALSLKYSTVKLTNKSIRYVGKKSISTAFRRIFARGKSLLTSSHSCGDAKNACITLPKLNYIKLKRSYVNLPTNHLYILSVQDKSASTHPYVSPDTDAHLPLGLRISRLPPIRL